MGLNARITILTLMLSACGASQSNSRAQISPLDISCNSNQHSVCTPSIAQRTAYLAIKWRQNQSCSTALLAADYQTLFDAHSEAVTSLFSGSITARFTQFKNAEGAPVTEFKYATSQICGFIDTNSNVRFDSGEPLLSENFDPTLNPTRVLKSWQ